MMIQNWRKDWKQGDFPFYFVQLAPWLKAAKEPGDSTWAELREAQLLTLKLPHTGMAVITDLGHEIDIHPTPKRPVGERLSLVARARTYGEKIVYSGPMYKGMKIDGNKAMLSFDHAGGGLVAKEMVPTDAAQTGQERGARPRLARQGRLERRGAARLRDLRQRQEVPQRQGADRRRQRGRHAARRCRSRRGALRLGGPSDLQPVQSRRAARVAVPHR